MNDIKKEIIELLLATTCHGIPNIIRAKKSYFLTLMWTLSLLICSGYLYYLTIMSIKEYLKYRVITSIEVINESPTLFPTVTICNLNGYSEKNIQNETIISCLFNNNRCNLAHFKVINFTSYGNCLRFNDNPDDLQKTYLADKYAGSLLLELFSGIPKTKSNDYFSMGYGFRIIINNQTDRITRIVKGVDVAPGFQTNILVDRIFYFKETIPYENCFSDFDSYFSNFDSEIVKEILNKGKIYQQSYCFQKCYIKMLKTKCNCDSDPFNSFKCLNKEVNMSCFDIIHKYFYISNYTECLPLCPLECNRQEFKLSTSLLNYPHLSEVESLLQNPIIKSKYENIYNVTVSQLRESVVSVAIYYEDLSYTVVSKEPKMNFLDLISNIGGIMGIFLGISFLSFLEIIEIIYVFISKLRK